MLITISPAKTLNLEPYFKKLDSTVPEFLDDTRVIAKDMAELSLAKLAKTLSVSEKLAELNFERFQEWTGATKPTANAFQAILMYDGDVYKGLDARNTFNKADFNRAQKTLRTVSGFYGLIRPLDIIEPYRLEMGRPVSVTGSKDLYTFWKPKLTQCTSDAIDASPGDSALVNLASNEYVKGIDLKSLTQPVVSPRFLDAKGNKEPKIIAFWAKVARGAMAQWLIKERVNELSALPNFDGLGYCYDAKRSTPSAPAFVRFHEA